MFIYCITLWIMDNLGSHQMRVNIGFNGY